MGTGASLYTKARAVWQASRGREELRFAQTREALTRVENLEALRRLKMPDRTSAMAAAAIALETAGAGQDAEKTTDRRAAPWAATVRRFFTPWTVLPGVLIAIAVAASAAAYRAASPVRVASGFVEIFTKLANDQRFVAGRSVRVDTVIDNRKHAYDVVVGMSGGVTGIRIDPVARGDVTARISSIRLEIQESGGRRTVSLTPDADRWRCINCEFTTFTRNAIELRPRSPDPQLEIDLDPGYDQVSAALFELTLMSEKIRVPFWRWVWRIEK